MTKESSPAPSRFILAERKRTTSFPRGWSIRSLTDWFAMSILGLAFIFNLGVMFLRARFVWCPLHPAGYVIGVAPGTLIINVLWLPS